MMQDKKKNDRKKPDRRIVAIALSLLVIAGAAAVFLHAATVENIFNPKEAGHFKNEIADSDDYDLTEGDGSDSRLADEDQDGEASGGDDSQEAVMAEKERAKSQSEYSETDPDGMKLADADSDDDTKANPDAYSVSDDNSGSDTLPTGNSGGSGDNGSGSGGGSGSNSGGSGSGGSGDNGGSGSSDSDDNGGSGGGSDNSGSGSGSSSNSGQNNGGSSNGGNTAQGDDSNGKTENTWKATQLSDKDPVVTEDGELLSISVTVPDNWVFCKGDSYSDDGVTVTATFLKDGETYTKEIPYGGSDGYRVIMSTQSAGKDKTAVFYYEGETATADFTVAFSQVLVHYSGYSEETSKWYTVTYPGTPVTEILGTLNVSSTVQISSGYVADLSEHLSRMIAYLGDAEIEAKMETTGVEYPLVGHLKTDADGYLTTMVAGFCKIESGALDEDAYVYYPLEAQNDASVNICARVDDVPDGFLIRRVVSGSGNDYLGEQVLVGYTGTAATLEVPLGVTKIELEKENAAVTSLTLPESVSEIDAASIAKHLPGLTSYTTTGTSAYQVVDGVLYSKDGKTLISCPAGKTSIDTWPDTVTTIAAGAFSGCTMQSLTLPDTVTTLEAGCFSDAQIGTLRIGTDALPDGFSEAGYTGILLVNDSDYDVIYKNAVLALGTADIEVKAVDADGTVVKEGLYAYDSRGIVVSKTDSNTLMGVTQESCAKYTVPDGITTIGSGAFAMNGSISEIEFPDTVTAFAAGSLASLGETETLILNGDDAEISPEAFGDTADGLPSLTVIVPDDAYETYLAGWSETLDPVYGDGAAASLLLAAGSTEYLYQDGAKYEVVEGLLGTKTYRLIRLYAPEDRSFAVLDGTTEIADGAFSGCDELEIVYCPESVTTIGTDVFAGLGSLETVIVCSGEASGLDVSGAALFVPDGTYASYAYDDGVVYGYSAAGDGTLLNAPTDLSGACALRDNTVALAEKAFWDCTDLTGLTGEDDTLKIIGAYCFDGCTGMTTGDFSACTSLADVGAYAFRGCSSLTELTLPNITELKEGLCYGCVSLNKIVCEKVEKVGDQSFYNCGSLSSLKDTASNLTEIGDQAFAYCASLTGTLSIPGVVSIGDGAFLGCASLTKVTLPECLMSIGEEAFRDCGSLTEVECNGSLEGISRYCFYGCRNLTTISFGDAQLSALTFVGVSAFAQCPSLEAFELKDATALTQIGKSAFSGCEALGLVTLPETLEEIASEAFSDCGDLASLTLYAKDPTALGTTVFGDTLPSFPHIFVDADALDAYVSAYTTTLDPEYGDGTAEELLGVIDENRIVLADATYMRDGEDLILEEVNKNITGTYTVLQEATKIADEAFKDCKSLTGVELPTGATISIGNRCFIGCDALETVNIFSSVPEWGDDTFLDCTSIKKVQFGEDSTCVIERIGTRAFKGCTGISNPVYVYGTIKVFGEECFYGCSSMASWGWTSTGRAGLLEIEDSAFENCTSLKSLVTSSFKGLTKIGDYAFRNCDTLSSPYVPVNVESIGVGCYMDCDNVKYVSIMCGIEEIPKDCFKNCPNLIRTGGTAPYTTLKKIGESAFEGCTSLSFISNGTNGSWTDGTWTDGTAWYIGKYVALEEIGANAFKGCTGLEDIFYLPGTVQTIGAGAFDGCSNLTSVDIDAKTPPTIGAIDLTTLADGFEIRCPDSESDSDSVYLAYFETLSALLGETDAWNHLDSVTDGAKARHPLADAENLEDDADDESADANANDTGGDTGNVSSGMGGDAGNASKSSGTDAAAGTATTGAAGTANTDNSSTQ